MGVARVAAGAAASLGALAAWALAEPHLPVLRHVSVPVLPSGAASLRVLHVSDLHLLPGSTRRARWVADLAAWRPDLVVSTGDHLSSAAAVPLLLDTFTALRAASSAAVFVPGNNDRHSPVPPSPLGYLHDGPPRPREPDLPWDRVATALSAAGWLDLTHQRERLTLRGLDVVLAGTDDAHLRRDRYSLVAGPVDAELGIAVTHTPQRRLLDAFTADGYGLLLAGHTHGGQLRVPGVGPLVTNCDLPRSQARGLSRWHAGGKQAWLHVSAGLGASPYLPVRFACRPEATLLDLVAP